MKLIVALTTLLIFSSCITENKLEQQKLYGSSQYGRAPVYSQATIDQDLEYFSKSLEAYENNSFANESITKRFNFLNTFLNQVKTVKTKYSKPYKVEGEGDQLFQSEDNEKVDFLLGQLQDDIIAQMVRARLTPDSPVTTFHQKELTRKAGEKERLSYKHLSFSYLESFSLGTDEKSTQELMREVDGLLHRIPFGFDYSYFKLSMDNSLEEKWQTPPALNADLNFEQFFTQGKGHPHLASLYFLLAHRRFRNRDAYQLEHPLVILDKEHVLPAFAKLKAGKFHLQAILPYARGKGLINYGEMNKLGKNIFILRAEDYVYAMSLRQSFSSSELITVMNRSIEQASKLYGSRQFHAWDDSSSQLYLFQQTTNIPLIRPLVTEITKSKWYQWLQSVEKDNSLLAEIPDSQ